MKEFKVIGPGRAGRSFARVLEKRGWRLTGLYSAKDDPYLGASNCDLLIISVPDRFIEEVANKIEPNPSCLVCHLSGSTPLGALHKHPRRGVIHPLTTIPDDEIGSYRLENSCYFRVCGDESVRAIVESFGGFYYEIREEDLTKYHLAASLSSNYVNVLLSLSLEIAESLGVNENGFIKLAKGALEDVENLGSKKALTGPVVRNDQVVLENHRKEFDLEFPDLNGFYQYLVKAAKHVIREAKIA